MKKPNTTGSSVFLLLAGLLAALVIPARAAQGADQAPVQTQVATENTAAPGYAMEVAPVSLVMPAQTTIGTPQPAAVVTSPSVEPPATSPPAVAAATTPTAAPTAAPTAPATAPTPPATAVEALPENTETAPVLVGPDDDRLLQEVEKHVVIVPAEPAIKIAEPGYDIPLDLNAKVLDYVEIFQTTRRQSFEAGLVRSRKYESLMKPIFAELGLPTDLYYLALIESGFNPKAYSYAKAMGVWQFISSTGKIYGLRRNAWIDERRDPEKSTRAAARHLKDLFDELGSWPLAFAAYNAGLGRVRREIAKAGTHDFWSLSLPAQTRNYVPAFFAALIIAKDPERYGFHLDYDQIEPSEVIEVGGGTRLTLVAALCRSSVDDIRDLNPELRQYSVPPGGKYPLKIPAGRTEGLIAGLAKVPAGRTTARQSTYQVEPGDTLFSIARRFGTTPESIREASRLTDNDIRPGQDLVIPGQRLAQAPIPRAPGRVVVSAAVPPSYRVRSGDNPWAIARRFDIPLDDLLAWNDLSPEAKLSIGQTIVLREPATRVTESVARSARTYEVQRGDNLWQISRKFDASLEELRRLNGFGEEHGLQPGDRVILP